MNEHKIYLDDATWRRLRQIALDRNARGVAELIRQAIDFWLTFQDVKLPYEVDRELEPALPF